MSRSENKNDRRNYGRKGGKTAEGMVEGMSATKKHGTEKGGAKTRGVKRSNGDKLWTKKHMAGKAVKRAKSEGKAQKENQKNNISKKMWNS